MCVWNIILFDRGNKHTHIMYIMIFFRRLYTHRSYFLVNDSSNGHGVKGDIGSLPHLQPQAVSKLLDTLAAGFGDQFSCI